MTAPHNGTDTSVIAAEMIEGVTETQRRRVMDYVTARGDQGATQEETALALDMGRPATCARFWELEGAGSIRKTTETRKTTSGRPARVYVRVVA